MAACEREGVVERLRREPGRCILARLIPGVVERNRRGGERPVGKLAEKLAETPKTANAR
jgi:hypothetical protein